MFHLKRLLEVGYRAKIEIDKETMDVQFMNWLSQLCAMIMPRNLSMVAGRGSAKTTEIQTERLIEMMFDLPGAPVAWVADTFTNLTTNVLPMVLEGLERKGFTEGKHFVIEKAPPTFTLKEKEDLPEWLKNDFWKPQNKIISYKRTMIFYTGLNVTFGSLDRPSSLAGRSYVHVFGDEAKYFDEKKIGNLLKAVRGYRFRYGNSPFYRGRTFTTDMPNISNRGEYDWIFKDAALTDPKMLAMIFKTAVVINEATHEFLVAKKQFYANQSDANRKAYDSKLLILNRWRTHWYNLRGLKKARTMFVLASSYVNVDVLSMEWFEDAIAQQLSDVNAAILSMSPKIDIAESFYSNLGERHFYDDGNRPVVELGLGFNDIPDCRLLKYLNLDQPIDMSADFGNMIGLAVAQKCGKDYRVVKTLHELPPNGHRELADKFTTFFAPMRTKLVKFYYDRSGNSYSKSHKDAATSIKKKIEFDLNGKPTGWTVQLMSLGQGNIAQADEYIFMMELLSGHNKKLPNVLIDSINCRPLKSSLELAKTRIINHRVAKDKRSERLPADQLPMRSTNFSDVFKYLMMRKVFIKAAKAKSGITLSTPGAPPSGVP